MIARAGWLFAAGALAACAWAGGATSGGSAKPGPVPLAQHFRSRPDLRPPIVTILHRVPGTAPGYVFLAPKKKVDQAGPMIIDGSGQVVWFDPLSTGAVTDFKVQHYRGRPVLTWWQGQVETGHGTGSGYVIMDDRYRILKVVQAGNGLTGDIHDFQLTPRGTALMTVFDKVKYDLSDLGGPRDGYVLEGSIQEVSVATGRVLWTWHSIDHVDPGESYLSFGPKGGRERTPFDYFHINSIAEQNGNLIISARHTHAVYEIRKRDGKILWRFGGKRSDFQIGPGAEFSWQHDARPGPGGTMTLFDNASHQSDRTGVSRALLLRVDQANRRVTLLHAYTHDPPLLSTSQANVQRLPDGHVFVGWGSQPYFTEYSLHGRVLLDGRFGSGSDSYRAFKFEWVGRPTSPLAITVVRGRGALRTVYASWNGATQVRRWQIVAGSDAGHLRAVAVAPKRGFETAIPVRTTVRLVAVRAVDSRGAVLGISKSVPGG